MLAMLDEPNGIEFRDDPNDYAIGSVPAADGSGTHTVVVTLLKKMGNNSAAAATTNLLRSFPNVQDVLMIGIAGGIPAPEDRGKHVRLGDIVVSDEHGVVQYDHVKRSQGRLELRGVAIPSSARLLGKVNLLEAARLHGHRPWVQHIARGEHLESATRPKPHGDRLFAADEPTKRLRHPRDRHRIPGEPKIHYGKIGSANLLLKDPTHRDRLRDELGIHAVEMEGSGIADSTWTDQRGFLVIRGVCDYCDAHKNDLWQGYAALAAAAYARALIESFSAASDDSAPSRIPEVHQGAEPALVLPSTNPRVSLLAFSSRATLLVGRVTEMARLDDFLKADCPFAWWAVVGPAGAGKSRLALELCRRARPAWNAGFLRRGDDFTSWADYRPSRPTLMVIDYVASRVSDASALSLHIARSNERLPSPVRVLLVEREVGAWWSRFLREDSYSESAELLEFQYDEPMRLEGLSLAQLRALAADIARALQIPWSEESTRTFEAHLRVLDPLARPLFAIMAAAYAGTHAAEAIADTSLLRRVLAKEIGRWRDALPDDERRRKVENLIILATLVGGLLPRSDGFSFLARSLVAALLPEPGLLDLRVYRDLVAAPTDDRMLAGLQPDVLGERFVLDGLMADGGRSEAARRLLQAAWTWQPDDLCSFILRAASDFPGDTSLDTLCDLSVSTATARSRWGGLVGDLVAVANRSSDPRSQRLLARLRALAGEHLGEKSLQDALARAELHLGNVFLFTERQYGRALEQYEAAIVRAGPGSELAAAAVNNRGILQNAVNEEEGALQDWSSVISNPGLPDEYRASSLNNRADIFARRGAHEDAIRDRSDVLALRDTSPDRRFIALLRRSRSYLALERVTEALADLDRIFATEDISLQQKAEARVERGAIYRDAGRLDEARADFEAVLASDVLFPWTPADALVELGELYRIQGDGEMTRQFLDAATEAADASGGALVEALVVRARLYLDEGSVADAESIWQSILTNPGASPRQRRIAENRGEVPA